MACPCGSHTLKHRTATHSTPENVYELSFSECAQCTRIGYERLTCSGELVSEDAPARIRFQQLSQNPAQKWANRVAESLYRPYKIWITPDRQEIRVCLIKMDSQTTALCPEYRLVVEGEDYLETLFSLSGELKKALKLPTDTILAATDSAPFELTWGTKPAIITERMQVVPPASAKLTEDESHQETAVEATPPPEPEVPEPQPELTDTPEPEPEPAQSPAPEEDQGQLVLL